MGTITGILEIGKRALIANQDAIGVIGHNMSNVNTEGYTRQRPFLEATSPMDNIHYGQIGTGVTIDDIVRVRDTLLDKQLREGNSSLGEWSALDKGLAEIQNIFPEPTEYGLGNILSDFFNGWADLANDPQSYSARSALRERATTLTDTLNSLDTDLRLLENQLNVEYKSLVSRINELARLIGDLNSKISSVENVGQNANDLRDKRDLLLDELSSIVDIQFFEQENGSVSVFIGSDLLVQDNAARELTTKSASRNNVAVDTVVWAATYGDVRITSGALKGVENARDTEAENIRMRLDEFASKLMEEVNSIHSSGYGLDGSTGINFFDPDTTGAGNISLSTELLQDLSLIAAAKSDATGDNENALELASLANQKVLNNGHETFGDHYSATVSEIGSHKNSSSFILDQNVAVVNQVHNQRESVHGVVMDEELTEMIKYQRAYSAAARIISTVNELMAALVNLGR